MAPAAPAGMRCYHLERVQLDLSAEFSGALSAELIRRTIYRAIEELAGEVPPGALPEFLHRLAGHRLSVLTEQKRRGLVRS